MNSLSMMIDFEQGNLSEVDTIKLFSFLVKTGKAWQLQGFYGRTAHNLIDSKIIDKRGTILVDLEDFYE